MRPTDAGRLAPPARPHARAGAGRLTTARVDGQSAVVGVEATSPLKWLVPRPRGPCAWAFAGTFGGGLLAGDAIDLELTVGPGSTLLVGTQASTKVFRSPAGVPARQALRATIADGATLLLLPDPVTPFATAVYEQRQRFEVSAGGSLVSLDWLTAGRCARGERWAFARYVSRNDVLLAGRHAVADALRLDAALDPIDAPHRMGPHDCAATVMLLGPRVAAGAARVLDLIAAMPVTRGAPLIASASPIADGAIVRVLGASAEAVSRFLRERLAFAWELTGEDPWSRKP